MVKNIFLYRHGERSDLAPLSRQIPYTLFSDPPLTSLGHLQAEAASIYLLSQLPQNSSIKLISSPFIRCLQTIEKLAQKINLPIHIQDIFGEFFDEDSSLNLYIKTNRQVFPINAEIIEDEPGFRPEETESISQIPERMKKVCQAFLPLVEEEVLVVCTHLDPIWGFVKACGSDVDYENGSYTQVAEFEYSCEKCIVVRQGVDHFVPNEEVL